MLRLMKLIATVASDGNNPQPLAFAQASDPKHRFGNSFNILGKFVSSSHVELPMLLSHDARAKRLRQIDHPT
ncbi:hypothetical protein V6N13_035417 [Hibiscus sabdariffa]